MNAARLLLGLIIICFWTIGCIEQPSRVLPTLMPLAVLPDLPAPTRTQSPTRTQDPLPTPIPPAETPPTPTPVPTSTPDATPMQTAAPAYPYAGLTLAELRSRSYGGGQLQIDEIMTDSAEFTRTLISYPSDGLNITGFMNVPKLDGPLPVVLLLHGYVDPASYDQLTYTTSYADQLARDGFLVIHPAYRNHVPSDSGPNSFRIGYAIDVLNLIALVRAQGGQPGPLAQADPERINLWGHSMGGGVALRVATVSAEIDKVVVYGSMSPDERKNFKKIFAWSDGRDGEFELATPPELLAQISPIFELDQISAEISAHHGGEDRTVPPEWFGELCQELLRQRRSFTCYNYPGQDHIFTGSAETLFQARVREFFRRE